MVLSFRGKRERHYAVALRTGEQLYILKGVSMSGIGDDDLYDLTFEDELEEEEEKPNPHLALDGILPDAPKIGGFGYKNTIHGREAKFHGGISSSPKLFAQASVFPECSQLRIWKVENGVPVGMGVIDSGATEEDLVREFPNAMPKLGDGKALFKLRPLNIDGEELGHEFTIIISEHHASLKRTNSQNGGVGGHIGGVPNGLIDLLKDQISMHHKALEEERLRTQTLFSQTAQERVDLATNAAVGVQNISERMLEADRERHEVALRAEQERNKQAADAMSQFFQSNIEMMNLEREKAESQGVVQMERDKQFYDRQLEIEQQRRERDRLESQERVQVIQQEAQITREKEMNNFTMMMELERQRRDREQQEYRERLDQMKMEWEHKRLMEREEWDRRAREQELKLQREREDMERKERERRHELQEKRIREERMLQERQMSMKQEHEMVLRKMEMDAERDREHQERMMQLQSMQFKTEHQGSFKETLKEGMETLRDLGLEPMDLLQKITGGGGEESSSNMLGDLAKLAAAGAEAFKEQKRAEAAQAQGRMLMQAPPQGPLLPQEQAQMQPQLMQEEEELMLQQIQESPAPPPQVVSTISLESQRNARKALFNLVDRLRSKADEKWEETITIALTGEPAIYHYIQDVSLFYALAEAGSTQEFSIRIANKLKESSLVPENLNYGGS